MTLRLWGTLGLLVGLTACQVPVKVPDPVTSKIPTRAKASPGPRVSASPSESPTAASPSPQASASTPAGLIAASASAAPQAPTRLLKGVIRIDAHYVVSAGGGNIVSNGSGNVLAVQGGTLISNNGSNLTVPSASAASGLRVLQSPIVAVGQMLPAQGVAVVAISLVTGQPLGRAVLTDAKGNFEVEVPESIKDNVRLLSAVPASGPDDPILKNERLQYSVITAPTSTEERVIDEDTAVTTQFIRFSFTRRLLQFLTLDDPEEAFKIIDTPFLPDALKPQIFTVLQELRKEAKAAGIDALSPDGQLAMTQTIMDAVSTRVDMGALMVDSQFSPKWSGPPAPALPVLVEVMKINRQQAGLKLAAEPNFFKTVFFLAEAKIMKGFEILRPTDFNEFLVREYLVLNETGVYPKAFLAMESIDAILHPETGVHMGDRIEAAGNSIMLQFVQAIFFNKNGAKDTAIATIRGQ